MGEMSRKKKKTQQQRFLKKKKKNNGNNEERRKAAIVVPSNHEEKQGRWSLIKLKISTRYQVNRSGFNTVLWTHLYKVDVIEGVKSDKGCKSIILLSINSINLRL